MSRDQQIEEMAIELSKVNCKPKGCGYCYLEYGTLENSCEEYLFYKKMAIALYNAGYRKSTDLAEEIFAEIEKILNRIYNTYVFEDNDYSDDDVAIECAVNYGTEVAINIAELKKKYIGKDTNVTTNTEEGK